MSNEVKSVCHCNQHKNRRWENYRFNALIITLESLSLSTKTSTFPWRQALLLRIIFRGFHMRYLKVTKTETVFIPLFSTNSLKFSNINKRSRFLQNFFGREFTFTGYDFLKSTKKSKSHSLTHSLTQSINQSINQSIFTLRFKYLKIHIIILFHIIIFGCLLIADMTWQIHALGFSMACSQDRLGFSRLVVRKESWRK